MSTLTDSIRSNDKRLLAVTGGFSLLLIVVAIAIPNLQHSRIAEKERPQTSEIATYYSPLKARATAPAPGLAENAASQEAAPQPIPAAPERRIIRTGSLELVVQHPADAADKISAIAENLGGYVESSEGGGQNATSGMLTIRVPANRFELARAEIRKLGLRVETEKLDAQDVTQRYVDQDATLRNLKAEEAQYLTILKQAGSVKDLLAVSGKLSEVRGQIEQQQAEFNALSKQTETVAISIVLRTEAEAQVLGLNWRPGYQIKLALRDGLESLATYATAMTAILFYLPSILLWAGTILAAITIAVKLVRWTGRRWFGWQSAEPAPLVTAAK